MANVGTAAAGKTLIGSGIGASPTFVNIGTNSGLAAHGVVLAEGNSAFTVSSPGASGTVLMSNGASADPTFQTGGTTFANTITGNSGGALSPTAGNWNILGTGSTTASGSGSTLTVQMTGLTNHNVLVGAGTATITNVAPSATSGVPLISQGSSADPVFGTAVVAGGGTGDTSFTAYSVICGGTTSTGALQNVSGVGSSGQVLTSNGASALPTWQAAGGGISDYFSAYLGTTTSAVTGDNTLYGPIVFNTALSNPNSNYSTSTGLYTAPATGVYCFQFDISLFNNVAAQAVTYLICWDGSVYSARAIQMAQPANDGNLFISSASITIPMTSGDTMGIQVLAQATSNTKCIVIEGGAPTGLNYSSVFSGFRIH